MERWRGKVAVVTGASAGIGSAICVHLANAGLRVVGLARRVELIDKLNSDVTGRGHIYSRQCDVSKVEHVASTFADINNEFGGTDILVNNAGVLVPGHITDVGDEKLSDESILSILDINFKGLVMCTREAVSSMKKRHFDGHIVFINSLTGHYVPMDSTFNVYSNTKYAVTAFTDALLNEFADFNCKIKVTSLSPGLVRTPMTAKIQDKFPTLEPSDIADAVLYVLSTPPHVNIKELSIGPVSEKRM